MLMATPSHHRVHHDRRVHKNFGGVFIIWDRMFGTFQDELDHGETSLSPHGDETCYFGIKERVTSWTEPVTQVLLWTKVFNHGLRNVIAGPGWITAFIPRPLPVVCPPTVKRLRVISTQTTAGKCYLWAQYTLVLLLVLELLVDGKNLGFRLHVIRASYLVCSFVIQGLMLDGSLPFVSLTLEVMKCAALPMSLFTAVPLTSYFNRLALYHALASVIAVLVLRSKLLGRPVER